MDDRRHKHRKKRGSLGRQALGVSFVNSVHQDKGYGGVFPSTDTYAYNAQRVNLDYLGNAYLLPKHALYPEGLSYFQNLFAADGVDWTDVASNWTVAGDCTLTYMGGGVLRVQGVTSSATPAAITLTIPYSDIEGRTFSFLAYAWAANSGEKVGCTLKRRTGGTLAGTNLTVTTTATSESEAIAICSNPVTGNASNRDIAIEFRNDLALSDDFYIKFPGIIEWRTGQDTSKPPMPEDIKCFVPVGPELMENGTFDSGTTGWAATNAAIDSVSGRLEVTSTAGFGYAKDSVATLVTGQRYIVSANGYTGTVTPYFRVGSSNYGTEYLTGSGEGFRSASFDATGAVAYISAGANSATPGLTAYFDNVSLRESANGFHCSDRTPANTVSGGVITRGTGTLLHPWHWERIGYSVPVKVKDQYDPFATSTAMNIGSRTLATDGKTVQRAYNNVEAFPNLLPEVDAANWNRETGTGSITDQGDGTWLVNDGDTDNFQARWDVGNFGNTIPADTAYYKYGMTLRKGTHRYTTLYFAFATGASLIVLYVIDWQLGTVTRSVNAAATGSETCTLASAPTFDVDQDYTLLVDLQNDSGASLDVNLYGDFSASESGTFYIVADDNGDAAYLQRVSAAAEPTWNTLRPGDSVTQYVLQQEDSETTWNLFNSATTITGLPDPTGGTGAFSLTDAQGAATSYLSQNNLDIAASAGDTIYYGGWLQKEAANDAYPGIALLDIDNGSAFTNMIADKVNGEVIWDTGQEGDWLVCIDGAVFAALFPDVYPDGANFWLIIAAMTAVSANNYRIDIQPARADAFDGGVDTSAQGTATFFRPFVTKNALFPFFDSIATTSTVTETVQDWSKIFTFLTEASNNVCNAIFSHGYATNLGAPIEPATTQDMATAAVLATGGSASTYPTSWAETDVNSIIAPVGEGVSPIHPDARYIDVRVNNTTGSNQNARLDLSSTVTGVAQGDDITVSLWTSLVAGSVAGDVQLGINERDGAEVGLVNTLTTISLTDSLRRVHTSETVANASTARYRPCIFFNTVPDGTDFTIRITLPNSVQQDFLSSVILGQETRTSQVGALRYDISNFSVSNTQIRADVSLGIPQADIAAVQNIWAVNSSNANRGLRFGSNGNFGIADSAATTLQIVDWSASADEVIRSSVNFDSGSSTFSMSLYSTTLGTGFDSDTYSGSMAVDQGVAIGDVSLAYPMHIHGLWSIPNGYESSVTLTSDSERYTQ